MKVAIIGGGWLGLPLSQALMKPPYEMAVSVSKRTQAGADQLNSLGLTTCVYSLGEPLNVPSLDALFDAHVLVINIAPGRKTLVVERFFADMLELITHARQSVPHIVFISTTSVYGNATRQVYEYSPTAPLTASAKMHVSIENALRTIYQDDATILRLAGLVAQDRHPATTLVKKANIANGQQVVNLIHREDVIAAIATIIQQKIFGKTLHLCSSEHPTRQAYYTRAAVEMGLQPPAFMPTDSTDTGKLIDASLTLETLGFDLKYPSPYDMT